MALMAAGRGRACGTDSGAANPSSRANGCEPAASGAHSRGTRGTRGTGRPDHLAARRDPASDSHRPPAPF